MSQSRESNQRVQQAAIADRALPMRVLVNTLRQINGIIVLR